MLMCYVHVTPYINVLCSLKPYNIKEKTVTTNAVDSTAEPLSVMITDTELVRKWKIENSWRNCRTVGEIVEQL